MSLAEIKQTVDTISETWRDGTPQEQRAELVQLDDALTELMDAGDTGTSAMADTVDELRGRIEILMDEIEINLGMEPEPLDVPEELILESEQGESGHDEPG